MHVVTAEELVATVGPAEARRAAFGAYWRRGDLSYRFSDLQVRVRNMVHGDGPRRCGWLASRRAGKSRSACGIAMEAALAYPGVYIPYAAPTATQVRTFIDPHLRRIAAEAPDDLAPDHADGKWVTPPLQWLDAHGDPVRSKAAGGVYLERYRGTKREEVLRQSVINARGCEDTRKADALRGPGTVLAICDEARDIPILDYVLTDVLGPMLWEARSVWGDTAKPRLIITTTAPRQPDHPFVDVWEGLKSSGAYVHSTIYDADHLTAEDVAEARREAGGEDTLAWRREALAMIERDPRLAVFPEFSVERHLAELERPSHFLPAVIGDGGFVDLAGYLFGYYDFERAAYVIEDELVFRRTRSDEQDRNIAAREVERWGRVDVERRRVDAPPQVRADMNRPEWGREWSADEDVQPPHWLGVTKPRRRNQGSMEAGVNRVRKLLNEGRIFIHPRCQTLISHALGARWDQSRSSFVRVKDEDGEPLHHYDLAAALVYFVRDVNDYDNPIPELPNGVGLPTHLIRKHLLKGSKKDDAVRGLFGRKESRR